MKKRYTFLPENWLHFGLISALAASFSLNLQAQNAPAKQWDKTFGGKIVDKLSSMQQTSDGGYILGGTSNSGIGGDKTQTIKGANDYWVVKLDANGNKLWDKTFGGSDEERLYCIEQTSDGGYILGGVSDSGVSSDKTAANKGSGDYWVIKLDASGNKIWDKTFGGSSWDDLHSLQQASDGGYILGGYSQSGITGDKSQACQGSNDYWVVKLNSSGNKMWDKTFGGSDIDQLSSLQQTSDGGYILGGNSISGLGGDKTQVSKGLNDYWVIKLDSSGNKTWDKAIGGNSTDWFTCLQQTSDGGYILGGFSESGISMDKTQANKGITDYWIVKLDSSGNKIWDRTLGGSSGDGLYSLQQTSDGGYILGGGSDSGISGDKSEASQGSSDYWVVKLDTYGNKIWDKSFGGSGKDILNSLQQTSDGGIILGGFSDSPITGDKTQASKGAEDYWIVKIGGTATGLKETEVSFAVSISPNPNQGKFTLQLSNLTTPKAEVIVSDLLGRVVLQQQLTVSNNQLSEELTLPYAKGMYLLQVKAGNQVITRKIVVE